MRREGEVEEKGEEVEERGRRELKRTEMVEGKECEGRRRRW